MLVALKSPALRHMKAATKINHPFFFFHDLARSPATEMRGHHEDSVIRKDRRRAAAASARTTRGVLSDNTTATCQPPKPGQAPITITGSRESQQLDMYEPGQAFSLQQGTNTPDTPPATLTAAEIVTPQEGKTYTHVSHCFHPLSFLNR